MIVFAHAGHWLVSLAYIAPLIFLVGVILVGKVRDRRSGSAPIRTTDTTVWAHGANRCTHGRTTN